MQGNRRIQRTLWQQCFWRWLYVSTTS